MRLLNQALLDLDDIYTYIAGNLLEPGVAAEMIDALESEILSLEYLPYRYTQILFSILAIFGQNVKRKTSKGTCIFHSKVLYSGQ